MATRETQRKILAGLLEKTPGDIHVQEAMLGHDLAVARIEGAQGDYRRATEHLEAGRQAALALVRDDPTNKDFAKQARMFELFQVRTWLAMPAHLRPAAETIAERLGDCGPGTTALADDEIGDFCTTLRARILASAGKDGQAQAVIAPVLRRSVGQHDVLTARWGLNIAEEARMPDAGKSGRKITSIN
jgi:hypothetical protein